MVVMAFLPHALNDTAVAKVYLTWAIKFIVLDTANIKLVALCPFVVSIQRVTSLRLVASYDAVSRSELACHSFAVQELAFELYAIVVDQLSLAVGFAVVEIPDVEQFVVLESAFALFDSIEELAFVC